MIEEQITNPGHLSDDIDESLRPSNFEEFIGQSRVKENIQVYVQAANMREQALDHCLLYGPPGLGKTTLASIIAQELNRKIKITAAPAFEKQGDLMAVLTSLEEGDVLFIDEIHRLKRVLEEILYSAMEDFKVDIIIGEGTGAKTIRIDIPRFTLVGATTRVGAITAPLRSRFGIIERMEFYQADELQRILKRSSRILDIAINEEGAMEMAKRSRGTPRIANRLLKRSADFALVNGVRVISREFCEKTMDKLQVDSLGLDLMDRKLLRIIIEHYGGGPAGLNAISAALSEETDTIEDVYEPYLIQQGFIQRTPRGRMASRLAYEHLGIDYCPANDQPELFD